MSDLDNDRAADVAPHGAPFMQRMGLLSAVVVALGFAGVLAGWTVTQTPRPMVALGTVASAPASDPASQTPA